MGLYNPHRPAFFSAFPYLSSTPVDVKHEEERHTMPAKCDISRVAGLMEEMWRPGISRNISSVIMLLSLSIRFFFLTLHLTCADEIRKLKKLTHLFASAWQLIKLFLSIYTRARWVRLDCDKDFTIQKPDCKRQETVQIHSLSRVHIAHAIIRFSSKLFIFFFFFCSSTSSLSTLWQTWCVWLTR